MPAASINCLAVVLKELGWSYARLIAELRRHATSGQTRCLYPRLAIAGRRSRALRK